VVRECIHKFKYHRHVYLGKSLGGFMVENLREFPLTSWCDLIVPVPLNRVKERER
jgi:predicted amidophosphoribosyltransferase